MNSTSYCSNYIPNLGFSFLLQSRIFSKDTYVKIFNCVASVTANFFSAKQSVRPDLFLETIAEVSSKAKTNFMLGLWRCSSIFRKHIPATELADYVHLLTFLNTPSFVVERQALDRVLSLATCHENYLDKFDFLMMGKDFTELKKQHNLFKKLFSSCSTASVEALIFKLQKLINGKEDFNAVDDLPESEKLSLNDINILLEISSAKKILETLAPSGISTIEAMSLRWAELEKLSLSPFFEKLKQLCIKSRPPGTIFLGDRRTFQVLNGNSFDCTNTLQQLFMGRICHIGIFVNPQEKGLHLSHVNRITDNHAVVPIRNPLSIPFAYSLTLNIEPLLPSHLSKEHKQQLMKEFSEEFQRLAEESRPELPLAGSKQHIKTLFAPHKTFSSHKLREVNYPPKSTPTMCSTYVGITFLKAIYKVNSVLREMGIQEQIPHPFGEHEDLGALDILRLIYLWKRLKIIQPTPMNQVVGKFFSIASLP